MTYSLKPILVVMCLVLTLLPTTNAIQPETIVGFYNTSYNITMDYCQIPPCYIYNITNATNANWNDFSRWGGPSTSKYSFYQNYSHTELNNASLIEFTILIKYQKHSPGPGNFSIWNYTAGDWQLARNFPTYVTLQYLNYTVTATHLNDFVVDDTLQIRFWTWNAIPVPPTDFYESNVTAFYGNAPVWVIEPENHTFYRAINDTYTITAIDAGGLDSYSLSNSSHFQVGTSTGIISSNASENVETTLIVFVNDTTGNTINKTVTFRAVWTSFFNCTDEDNLKLNITFLDEISDTPLSSYAEVAITDISNGEVTLSDYSEIFNQTTSIQICSLIPQSAGFAGDIRIDYTADGYATRRHFYDSFNFDDSTIHFTAYQLEDSLATNTKITGLLATGVAPQNAIVEAHRYFTGINTYKLTAMGRLDNSEGTDTLPIEQGYTYKLVFKIGSTLLAEIIKENVLSDIVILPLTGETITMNYTNHFEGVSYGFSPTDKYQQQNITVIFSLSAEENDLANWGWLVYRKFNSTQTLLLNESSSVASGGSLSFYYFNQTGKYHIYAFFQKEGQSVFNIPVVTYLVHAYAPLSALNIGDFLGDKAYWLILIFVSLIITGFLSQFVGGMGAGIIGVGVFIVGLAMNPTLEIAGVSAWFIMLLTSIMVLATFLLRSYFPS